MSRRSPPPRSPAAWMLAWQLRAASAPIGSLRHFLAYFRRQENRAGILEAEAAIRRHPDATAADLADSTISPTGDQQCRNPTPKTP